MPECTVVIVNYNARDYLEACLSSLRESLDCDLCEVVVVDNASTDGSQEMVGSTFPGIDLLESDTNLGFARANNLGLAKATTPYVLLLNSDTIVSKDALERMIEAMDALPDLQVCTCQHLDGSGTPSKPYGRFPSLRSELMTLTGAFKWPVVKQLIGLRGRLALRLRMRSRAQSDDMEQTASGVEVAPVDWVNGACMMLRREFVWRLGGLDESFFFYGEDIDLCRRIWQNGGTVGFLPSPQIVHYGGGSCGSNYLVLLRQYMIAQSQFFSKHYSASRASALQMVYAGAGLLSFVKWVTIYGARPGRRETARRWISFWLELARNRDAAETRRLLSG